MSRNKVNQSSRFAELFNIRSEVLGLANGLLDARGESIPSAEQLQIGPHGHTARLQGLPQRCHGGIVVDGRRQEDGDWHTVPSLAPVRTGQAYSLLKLL